jgi:amidase/aspartyl-tRNA(Asn)/glutamyl-tRNA(Gln) amidotransferase subunit A
VNEEPRRARDVAAAVREGRVTAVEVIEETLATIAALDSAVHAFTDITAGRARAEARAIDERRRSGEPLPPLAGVPYAVKNLFDVEGLPTLAGSAIHRRRPAASRDAVLVRRLRDAGAILVGTLNMDPYAYGFTGENAAFGPTRNPHDPSRISGGSSAGSAASVAAGMVPLTLGSDTNGSIRVPASFCGVFGLKPTYGRLPRTGSFPFVASLDCVGPFARNVADLAAAYDVLQGHDGGDSACAARPVEPTLSWLEQGMDGLRVARLTGYFDEWAGDEAREASHHAARALGAVDEVEWPEVARARAAAFVITAAEAGALHLATVNDHYDELEPLSRDRLAAGALTPAAWYVKAQRVRAWFVARVREVFTRVDLLVAPTTPWVAPPIGTEWLEVGRRRALLRPSLGVLTQPISLVGLPVAAVPVATASVLPLGVQLIAPPWREDLCLRAARALEGLA